MQLGWITCLFFFSFVLAAEPPKELEIRTTYTPEECTVKATKGDSIRVHYVRYIVPYESSVRLK